MIKVGIIGATGYAGNELVRILMGHKDVEIKWYGSRSYVEQKYASVYQNMFEIVEDTCLDDNIEELAEQVDVIFTATPQGYLAGVLTEEILQTIIESNLYRRTINMAKLLNNHTVVQIGMLTDNIEKATAAWADFLGVDMPGISITDEYPVTKTNYRGNPSPARCKQSFFDLEELPCVFSSPPTSCAPMRRNSPAVWPTRCGRRATPCWRLRQPPLCPAGRIFPSGTAAPPIC